MFLVHEESEADQLTEVPQIVTGGVKTNLARHGTTLQPGSIYMPILDFFHKRVTDSQGRYLLTLTISVTRLTKSQMAQWTEMPTPAPSSPRW